MKKPSDPASPGRRRGRPHKFGRPSRLLALTLPEDVVDWLVAQDPDASRAIVRIYDELAGHPPEGPRRASETGAEVVAVGHGRGLILVPPESVEGLPGVAAIPFVGGRAFLALEPGRTIADLELTVVDALEAVGNHDLDRRAALANLRAALRTWRTDPSLRFRERAIIVVERVRPRAGKRSETGASQ